MKFKIVNLWKKENRYPVSDFIPIHILSFIKVDCQYCIVILNFSFIIEYY
jgi:hypothetical protein